MFDILPKVLYNEAEQTVQWEGSTMDKLAKLALLGESAKYDVCASSSATPKRFQNAEIGRTANGVCHSFTPDGRCVSLFKVLLSNQCEKDCLYCPNRAGRDVPRSRFAPEELADLFMEFYRRNAMWKDCSSVPACGIRPAARCRNCWKRWRSCGLATVSAATSI